MNAKKQKTLSKIVKFLNREAAALGTSDVDEEIKSGLQVAARAVQRSQEFADGTRKAQYQYRIGVFPCDYEIGDAEDEGEVNAILERDGAWGFCVERALVADDGEVTGGWIHVDSCSGFLGNRANQRYMVQEAWESIPANVTEVAIVDERDQEINTSERSRDARKA